MALSHPPEPSSSVRGSFEITVMRRFRRTSQRGGQRSVSTLVAVRPIKSGGGDSLLIGDLLRILRAVRMVTRIPTRSGLLLLLAVGLAAQGAVAAAHDPLPGWVSSAPADSPNDTDHDSGSCGLCQMLSQVRPGLLAAPPLLPDPAMAPSGLGLGAPTAPLRPTLASTQPRGPPVFALS